MFAVAFDLVVREAEDRHPLGVSAAYGDIARVLGAHGFVRIQGSVYVAEREDLANLASAMGALKQLTWFPECVRDIRAFRVEMWSDFTGFMQPGAKA